MFDPKRISHAAIVVLVFVFARSILGIAVRSSVAALYGASDVTDAYFAAMTIPRRGGDFIVGSVVAFVIIPVMARHRAASGDKAAATDVIGLFNVLLLAALALSAGIWLGAPLLLDYVVAPGFDEPARALAITLTRWCSPLLLLFSVSLIYTSFMHVHRDFLTPALAAILFPLCSLLALWLLPRQLGIVALVYGNLTGCAVGFALMFLAIRKRLPWRPTLRLGDRAVGEAAGALRESAPGGAGDFIVAAQAEGEQGGKEKTLGRKAEHEGLQGERRAHAPLDGERIGADLRTRGSAVRAVEFSGTFGAARDTGVWSATHRERVRGAQPPQKSAPPESPPSPQVEPGLGVPSHWTAPAHG